MANWIKQGDAYMLPVDIRLNDAPLDINEVEMVEFRIGDVRRVYPGEAEYRDGQFYMPLTQEETFSFEANKAVAADVRVCFNGGNVMGVRKQRYITVFDALSEEEL